MERPAKQPITHNIANNKGMTLVILLLFVINSCFSRTDTTAQKGILNVQNRTWTKNGLIDLNGEWEFYWNALYAPADFAAHTAKSPTYAVVPGYWNTQIPDLPTFIPAFGYATYRLKVLCPPSDEPLALQFLTVASAYKLFVNGRLLAVIGKAGTSKATTTPAFQPVIVPVTPVNNQLDIVIQVTNFTYHIGGLWDFIKLGTQAQISTYHTRNIAHDFFIAGSFFIIGIFYLLIYFFFRRRKSPLYFALFCILIGMRPLVTGELGIYYVANWSWQFTKHIEYLFVYLTVPVLSLFSYELFSKEFSKKILRYILIISVPFVAATLFTTPFVFRYTLTSFQVFAFLSACYGLYVYICAVKNNRTGSIYLLAGFVFLFITIINDILYSNHLINSTYLLYAGLYIFIICQAITLSRQFLRAFIKIERLNEQMEQVNDQLQQKNETIHKTNEQLTNLNTELDSLVFRTSHDLRSPITSLYAMTDMIKMEENAQVRNEYIDFQKKTIQRLDTLITEILHFAKDKSTALHYEEVNLQEFIKYAVQDQQFSYDSENVERIIEVHQPVVFTTDRVRLGMIITNLISNALKHHNKQQENPYLKIVAHATEKEARIEITDNGQGIPQDQLDHIFTMYYRVNTKSAGSGFGLYIVKDAIKKLSGTIKVESKVNAGTSFFIVIPNGELAPKSLP